MYVLPSIANRQYISAVISSCCVGRIVLRNFIRKCVHFAIAESIIPIKELLHIRKLKTFLTVIAILILLLLLTFLICLKLAYTDENTDKYYSEPDISAVQSIAMNAVLGNQSDITEDQLNSMIAYLIEQANEKGLFNKEYKLLAAYFDINTGKPSRLYFQIEHNEKKLGFSADVEIYFNRTTDKIELIFSNAKVGKLTIPKKFIVSELKKTDLEAVADYISFEDLSVNLPTDFSFEIPGLGTLVEVDIENLEVFEDQIHLETNPILNDTIDNFKNSISDKIIDFAQDYLPENIGGYLDNFKKSE